jgi:Peptidase M50B-like
MLGGMHATHGPPPGTLAPLPGPEAALIGLVALAVVAIPFLWRLAGHLDAMAHEGAHAVAASAVGFTLLGVTLNREAGGATSYLSRAAGSRRVLTSFVGYLGPSAFGLGGARLIETGHVVSVLWVSVVLLVLLLFLVRKSFGVASVPAAIALLALVARSGHAGLEEVASYGMTWVLLLSGVRTAVGHNADAGDAWTLSAITPLPRRFWALLWIGGALLAVVIGGKWLVLRS